MCCYVEANIWLYGFGAVAAVFQLLVMDSPLLAVGSTSGIFVDAPSNAR